MSARRDTVVRAWHREPLVWMLIGIPLSSVVMGVVMLWLSVASFDGLVADDYYKRGLEINRVLDRDRAAQNARLSGELDLGQGGARLTLEAGHAGFAMPAAVTLELSYATQAGRDRELALIRIAPGDYAGPVVSLHEGRYYVQVTAGDWRLSGALQVPGSGRLHLAPRSGL
jgi:hypothetical protein